MENFGVVFEKIAMLYFEAPVEGSGLYIHVAETHDE
jgi:hypothetical protein